MDLGCRKRNTSRAIGRKIPSGASFYGRYFRSNIKEGTDLGQLAKSYIDKGALVPDEVTIGMLEAEVNSILMPKDLFLMAFQNSAQAEALDVF